MSFQSHLCLFDIVAIKAQRRKYTVKHCCTHGLCKTIGKQYPSKEVGRKAQRSSNNKNQSSLNVCECKVSRRCGANAN